MPIWPTQYLSDLIVQAEQEISEQVPCIYSRFAISVTQGISVYILPESISGIIRVTWKSWTVHPVFQRELRNNVIPLKPVNGDIESRPFLYMRQGYGESGIKFYPAPNETIVADQTNIFNQTGIASQVIISAWHIADATGSTYRVPAYIGRYLTKAYVLWRAFAKEGPGQNLEASEYYRVKYEGLLTQFKKIVTRLYSSHVRSMGDQFVNTYGRRPPHPRLPANFGYPV